MLTLESLQTQLVSSLKAGDETSVSTLRLLISRVKALEKEKAEVLSEMGIQEIISSELKKRKEAAKLYAEGHREDLAQKELAESALLEKFLPPQLSDAELGQAVSDYLASGTYSSKDMGIVIKALKEKLGQGVDGAKLALAVKTSLNQ